jgi:ribosomal protein S20
MEPLDPPTPPASAPEPKAGIRPTKLASGLVAGGAAFAMVMAGLGIANAQTDDSSSTPPPAASTPAPAPGDADGGHHHRPRAILGAGLEVAAKTLGISEEELRTQLQSGKSIADVAGPKTDEVIAAIVKACEEHLAADVAAGRLTQDEADARKADLTEHVTDFVNKVPSARGEGDGDGPGRPGHPGIRAEMAVVAKTIGITPAELRTQLEAGKSIAAIAGDKTDAVIAALVADAQDHLDQEVKAGKLTQAQADERKAHLTERVTALVNRTPPPDGEGRPGPGGPGGPGRDRMRPSLGTVAGIVGLSEDDLRTQLRSGKTLAAIAGDKTPQVVEALVNEAQAHLDQAVKDGKLTQAQADERKANLQQRITDMVNRTPPAGGPHHHGPDGDDDGDGPDDGGTPAQPESQPASVTA